MLWCRTCHISAHTTSAFIIITWSCLASHVRHIIRCVINIILVCVILCTIIQIIMCIKTSIIILMSIACHGKIRLERAHARVVSKREASISMHVWAMCQTPMVITPWHLDHSSTPWRFLNPLTIPQPLGLVTSHKSHRASQCRALWAIWPGSWTRCSSCCRCTWRWWDPCEYMYGHVYVHAHLPVHVCMLVPMSVCMHASDCVHACGCVHALHGCVCVHVCIDVVWYDACRSSACDLLFGTRPPRRHV